jgi:hypothetical protein
VENPQKGMMVQIDPTSWMAADPKYRKKFATIKSVDGKVPGQGDRIFVTLRFQASSVVEPGIPATLLVSA